MFPSRTIAFAAFAAVAGLAAFSFGNDRAVESTRIPLGRGQYVITQLPPAPQVMADAPYALTGVPAATAGSHVVVRLGMRGQTAVVPSGM